MCLMLVSYIVSVYCMSFPACRCRRNHPRAHNEITFDNCLMANTAALKLQASCDEDDILYCSFDNDVSWLCRIYCL